MAAEAGHSICAILAAAMTIAAVPASAQSNAANATRRKSTAATAPMLPAPTAPRTAAAPSDNAGGAGPAQAGAVFLPALIVDLFPNPVAPPHRCRRHGQTRRHRLPTRWPGHRRAAIVSPTDLIAVQRRRARGGRRFRARRSAGDRRRRCRRRAADCRFLWPAGALAAPVQAAWHHAGALRHSRWPPVGVVLAQLAADGRTQRREPNHVYSLQQAASIVNYAFDRIALDAKQASARTSASR